MDLFVTALCMVAVIVCGIVKVWVIVSDFQLKQRAYERAMAMSNPEPKEKKQ